MTAEHMRKEIMITVKANGLPVTGDFWLMLACRTEDELRQICQDMNINTRGN